MAAEDSFNLYGDFTCIPQENEREEWKCPIELMSVEECGDHPYAITSLPGRDGHLHHFSTKALVEWINHNTINPLTREPLVQVELRKLLRRHEILCEFPELVPIDYSTIFDPTTSMDVLYGPVEPSSFSCFFPFSGVSPRDRREKGVEVLEPHPVGSWIIRKGSIKSVEKAAGTNTPANSYVFMIRSSDGYKNIPFIHFFGYGFKVCFEFARDTDLTIRSPSLNDVTDWYFTFHDLLKSSYLSTLDWTKPVMS